jgi:hypothetical protein
MGKDQDDLDIEQARIPPPAGLTRRVAEVTQALFEAATARPGVQLPAATVNRWDNADATILDTLAALVQARDAGLVYGPLWSPAPRARELRPEIEEWFYAN